MKATIKAIIAASVLSSAGLCLSVSHSAAAQPQLVEATYKGNSYIIVNKYTSVNSADRDISSSNLFNTESFAQIFDKPLVKIPLDEIPEAEIKAPKSDGLFAITTLLNDRLQQFIASITHTKPSYALNDDGEMVEVKVLQKSCDLTSGN
ncbi:MAG: hypothetical protein CL811_09790 [Colwelliaceae bacterium]|nr:hypothetical protein [Colwelliaceae bacterium]|tara:strand:- start:352 stop:798 length:447 start_codon:yes stop_codon:yes gene_type:complete